jgi:hypothetical protein
LYKNVQEVAAVALEDEVWANSNPGHGGRWFLQLEPAFRTRPIRLACTDTRATISLIQSVGFCLNVPLASRVCSA